LDTLILTCFDKKKHLFKVIILHLAILHKFKFVDCLYQNVRNVGIIFSIFIFISIAHLTTHKYLYGWTD